MNSNILIFGYKFKVRDLLMVIILPCMSLLLFLLDFGITKMISVIPLIILSILIRSDIAAFSSTSAGFIACFFSPPFFAMSYIIYVVSFTAFINLKINRAITSGVKKLSITKVTLSFFSFAIFAGLFFMSLFHGISSRKFFSDKFLWINDFVVFTPAIISFAICIISFIVIETISKFSKNNNVDSPFDFTPVMSDYVFLAIYIAGSIFFIDDKIFFMNMVIFSTLPFVIDGARFIASKMPKKSIFYHILWIILFITFLPIIVLAICSLLQPWLQLKGWNTKVKENNNG